MQGPDGVQYDLISRSTSIDQRLSKLRGNQVGRNSNQIFTSWKYEKDKETAEEDVIGDIAIALCGGMNCLALGLKKRGFGKRISRYVSAENNDRARAVAKVANPMTEEFCGIDRERAAMYGKYKKSISQR